MLSYSNKYVDNTVSTVFYEEYKTAIGVIFLLLAVENWRKEENASTETN